MIRLLVEDYCQNCPKFEPDVIQSQSYSIDIRSGRKKVETDTTVECKHNEKCHAIFEYAKRQLENKEKSSCFGQ